MIKIIRNIKELENLKDEWNTLLQESRNNNVFLTYDWIYLWIKYFLDGGRRSSLFIVCSYDKNNKIEAIAPFFIKRFFLFFNAVMFISHDFSDYLDIIIHKQSNSEDIVAKILNAIKENHIANIIFLKQVSELLLENINNINKTNNINDVNNVNNATKITNTNNTNNINNTIKITNVNNVNNVSDATNIVHTTRITNITNTTNTTNTTNIAKLTNINKINNDKYEQTAYSLTYKESGDCYYIKLPDRIDEYMKQFNSKQRYNILSRVEKAKKQSVEYISSEKIDNDSLDLLLDNFFRLHQKRWNEKGQGGVFSNSKIKSFFKEIFGSLFKKNMLALSFLKYNNEFISAAICFDYAGSRQVYLPGFDTKYSNLYPGIVLTYYNIREAIDKKYLEFDFLKGGEEYKKRFLGIKRKNYKLYLYKSKFIFYIFKLSLFFNNEVKNKTKEYFLNIFRKR
jgi:hypothetical protein